MQIISAISDMASKGIRDGDKIYRDQLCVRFIGLLPDLVEAKVGINK